MYNTETYLKGCIDSILEQTFTDYELILVDVGSTDSSLAACEEYAAKESRVCVSTQSNEGVSKARNTGLAAAEGQYVWFLNSDDRIADGYLAAIHEKIAKENYDALLAYVKGKRSFSVKGKPHRNIPY